MRHVYSDVMKDYFTRARRGDWGSDPAIAAKTPDDIIRFTSFLFATTKQLDKVRSAVRWNKHNGDEMHICMHMHISINCMYRFIYMCMVKVCPRTDIHASSDKCK